MFQLGYPMELKNGSGSVKVDLAQPPLSVCIPANASTQLLSVALHEPSADPNTAAATSDLARLGFIEPGATTSTYGIPCPGATLPLPGSATGLPTQIGVGPVIGVAGGLAQ